MNFLKANFFFFLLVGTLMQLNAQTADLFNFHKSDSDYKQLAVITRNGVPLEQENEPDGPLRLDPEKLGKLTVSMLDSSGEEPILVAPIGFKVAVKDYHSNTVWMYSDETFYELDIRQLLKACDWGDELIFITVDQRYRLPRHQVVVLPDGC